tara:strand:- start:11 stop:604 length:594 start_codon:yes stop_codon:yes gene_type:complete
MALSEAAIKRNKKRRSNSATGKNILASPYHDMYRSRKLRGEIAREKGLLSKPSWNRLTSSNVEPMRTSKKENWLDRVDFRANTPSKENKVDKKSKENITSKRTSNGTGLRANTKSKENKKKDKVDKRSGETTKYKMVTAPHRNVTNKKVKVVDRPGKPRKKIMVNPGRGFKGGGKIYSVDNSGQKLVQKMYGGKIKY